MRPHEAIKLALTMSDTVWKSYVADLSDADLLVRPVAGANHVAWQLGHLISAEHGMVGQVCPGAMPPLPEGFAARHTKETAAQDEGFLHKEEYIRAFDQQRAGTLAALDQLSDADLDRPAPEGLQRIAPSVGGVFVLQASHWMMHAGQWAVLRRKLDKPVLI